MEYDSFTKEVVVNDEGEAYYIVEMLMGLEFEKLVEGMIYSHYKLFIYPEN